MTQHFISKRKNGNPLKIKNVNFLFAVLSVIFRSSNYFQWCIDLIYLKWLLHLWSYTNSLKLLCRNCSSCMLYLFLHLTASIMIFLDTWTNRSFFFFVVVGVKWACYFWDSVASIIFLTVLSRLLRGNILWRYIRDPLLSEFYGRWPQWTTLTSPIPKWWPLNTGLVEFS